MAGMNYHLRRESVRPIPYRQNPRSRKQVRRINLRLNRPLKMKLIRQTSRQAKPKTVQIIKKINDGGHVGKKPGGKGQDGRKNALDTNGENQTAAVILLENFVIPMDTENMLNSLKHAESNAETLAEHITDAANETVELTADTKGIDISSLKKAQPEVVDIKQKLIEQASAAPRETHKGQYGGNGKNGRTGSCYQRKKCKYG